MSGDKLRLRKGPHKRNTTLQIV